MKQDYERENTISAISKLHSQYLMEQLTRENQQGDRRLQQHHQST